MQEVILYSNDCPRCKILKQKLNTAGIKYIEENNIKKILETGIDAVPVLQVDNEKMVFTEAVKWISERN